MGNARLDSNWSIAGILAGALTLGLSSTAGAALLAYEGFDYSPGLLAGHTTPHGGTGWSNNWTIVSGTNDTNVTSGSLGYTSGIRTLVTSGNKISPQSVAPTGTRDANLRTFDADGVGAGTTFWISFLGTQTPASGNSVDETSHAGVAIYSATGSLSGTPQIFLGKPSGGTNWGFDVSNPTSGNTVSFNVANQTHFFLTKIVMPATIGGQMSISMWINPTLDGESFLGTPNATKNYTANMDPGRVQFSTNANVTGFSFDELRIGETYADVTPHTIPEPISISLLALGGMTMLRRRWGNG